MAREKTSGSPEWSLPSASLTPRTLRGPWEARGGARSAAWALLNPGSVSQRQPSPLLAVSATPARARALDRLPLLPPADRIRPRREQAGSDPVDRSGADSGHAPGELVERSERAAARAL